MKPTRFRYIIDLGKPSYVNGVILKIFFGRKSIVHADNDDDDNNTTKNITLNITLSIT